MRGLRLPTAILSGLLAWAAFGLMIVLPWMVDERNYFLGPRFYWSVALLPVVFILALAGVGLAGERGRGAIWALALSGLAGLAGVLYWLGPAILKLLGVDA